jgi:NitT/TauT family transport system substrate-binding protein
MRKIFTYVFLLFSVFFISFNAFSAPQSTQEASFHLRVGLNPWIGTGLFYMAKEKGFFDAEKVNVELVKYDDGAVGKQLLNSGHIDMLATTPETVVILSDAGVKVKVVGIMDSSKGADGIVATKDIKTLSALKGKKVAFEVGSSSHLLLSYFLEQKGLTTNDLTIVNLSAPDAGAAFVTGNVDAAVTWEPWLSKGTERPGGHILVDSKDLPIFPDFYIIRAQTVEKHPEAIRAMLRALFTAQKFALEHPAEAQKIVAKNLSISDANAAAEIKTLEWLDYAQNLKYFNGSPSKAQKLLKETSDLWLRLKLIKHKIEANKIVDPNLLKNLYQ